MENKTKVKLKPKPKVKEVEVLRNELLVIKNDSEGLAIELQSSQLSLEELFHMAYNIKLNFFKKNGKDSSYVG